MKKNNNNKINRKNKNNNNKAKKLNDARVMRATVSTTFEITNAGYQQQNVQFQYVEALVSNDLFQKFSQLYQFYKLGFIETIITPIVNHGTQPPIGYIYFQGNESNIDYTELPNLPGARKLQPNKTTYFKFTRPGRNPDFNYWYDTRETEPLTQMSAKLRFRFMKPWSAVDNDVGYHVRVKYHMKFSHVCLFSDTGRKEIKEQKIDIVGNYLNEDGTLEGQPMSNSNIISKYEKLDTDLSQQ
jgi:hypothetical protein